jgi:hypothetical protein
MTNTSNKRVESITANQNIATKSAIDGIVASPSIEGVITNIIPTKYNIVATSTV